MSESHPPNRPIIFVAVTPSFINDWESLQRALGVLSAQDQDVSVMAEPAERRVIISGMGELHLEAICDRLVREFKIPLDVGKPQVVHLETIRKSSESEAKYIRQVGGRGQYAHVKLGLEPGQPESGYQFIDQSPENAVPLKFIDSIDFGIREAMKGGVLAGNEMVGVRAVLRDGSYHAEDSNEITFQIAACMAFKEAARKANPVILEPFMSIDVDTSQEFVGSIVKDLSWRRGRIDSIEPRADSVVIHALAPLKELLGYALHVRCITQGRSSLSMRFARYAASSNNKPGADEVGVTANQPKSPKPRSGFAAARPDELAE